MEDVELKSKYFLFLIDLIHVNEPIIFRKLLGNCDANKWTKIQISA